MNRIFGGPVWVVMLTLVLVGCGVQSPSQPADGSQQLEGRLAAIVKGAGEGNCAWEADLHVRRGLVVLAEGHASASVSLDGWTSSGTVTWKDVGTFNITRTESKLTATTVASDGDAPQTRTMTLDPPPPASANPQLTAPGTDPVPLVFLYAAIKQGSAVTTITPQVSRQRASSGAMVNLTAYVVILSTPLLVELPSQQAEPWLSLASVGVLAIDVTVSTPIGSYYTLSFTLPIVNGAALDERGVDVIEMCQWGT